MNDALGPELIKGFFNSEQGFLDTCFSAVSEGK